MTIPDSEPSLVTNAVQPNGVESAENGAKKVSPTVRHPRYIDMVIEAVKNVKSRRTSLQAIKKYLQDTYRLAIQKSRTTTFIHKAINTAVENDILVSVKGKGAGGSFKLGKSTDKSKASPESSQVSSGAPVKSKGRNASNSESTKSKASKKTKAKPSKVPDEVSAYEFMVVEAVKHLPNESSSLHVIKKYLSDTFQVDMLTSAPFITKAIKEAVQKGTLVRVSGRGASGSFKLGHAEESTDEASRDHENPAAESEATANPAPVESEATANPAPGVSEPTVKPASKTKSKQAKKVCFK